MIADPEVRPRGSRPGIRVALLLGGLLVGAGLGATESQPASGKTLVILRSDVPVSGDFLLLEELLEIPSDPGELSPAIGRILLGLVPPRGEVREVSRDEIQRRLVTCGIPARSVRIEGSERAVVYRGRKKLTPTPEAESAPAPVTPRRRRPPEGTLVRQGERVRLRMDRGIVVLDDPAEALEDGGARELIEVKNLRTGAIVLARIERRGLVEARQLIESPGEGELRSTKGSNTP